MKPVSVRAASTSLVALALCACASLQAPGQHFHRHSARLITREDVERTGGADAFEVLKRSGTFLSIGEQKSGDIRASERGKSSILLSQQILLVVDEVMLQDLNALRGIRADTIDWMLIMSGAEATPIYGTGASNGVLVVRTRIPADH
jgi:hypothetical protein